jgi:hypothetical protein
MELPGATTTVPVRRSDMLGCFTAVHAIPCAPKGLEPYLLIE